MTNGVTIGKKEIGAIADSDKDNPDQIIGFLTFSTTGDVLVPREWLVEKWNEYELPSNLLPKEPTNWQAYRRTIRHLEDDSELLNYSVYSEEYNREFDCRLEIEKSATEGNNVFIVYARTFFPEEIVGEEGGDWNEQRIGHFDFYRPEDADLPGSLIHTAEIDKDNVHYDALERLFNESRAVMNTMKDHHIFNDMNGVLESFRHINQAVEVRRSVYFLPASVQDELESIGDIWKGLNQFKDGGESVRVEKSPVVDMKEQRDLIASRVKEKVQETVDDVVGEIIADFEDNDDETADAAANQIIKELEETRNITTSYNELLGMKLSVKEVLEERREELSEEAEEVVENVVNQKSFSDY